MTWRKRSKLAKLPKLLCQGNLAYFEKRIRRSPELVFISVVFSNITNLAVVILNSRVLKINFAK